MLNIFPNLLTYGILAPMILRLALGFYLIIKSYRHAKRTGLSFTNTTQTQKVSKILNLLLGVLGVFVVVGLFTQVAVLLVLIATIIKVIYKAKIARTLSYHDAMIFAFVMAISFSLMLSGAGFFAIDLPL